MASYSITDVTTSSFKVNVTIDTSYTYWRVFVRLASDTSDVTYDTDYIARSSNFSVTVTGLSPNTKYAVNVGYSSNASGGGPWLGRKDVTTEDGAVLWSWTSSNGTASAAQTQRAYAAITSKGYLSDFSYLVWNDLVNKTYEVVGTWDSTYGSLSSTRMTTSNKKMTANRFNAVWWNLEKRVSTGLTKKYTGDRVLGSYFVTLANALNNAILGAKT